MLLWYAFVVGLTPLLGYIYWRANNEVARDLSLIRAVFYAFVFAFYINVWLPVGWRATARLLRGERGWAKTLRLAVQPPETTREIPEQSPLATR